MTNFKNVSKTEFPWNLSQESLKARFEASFPSCQVHLRHCAQVQSNPCVTQSRVASCPVLFVLKLCCPRLPRPLFS